ncbi:CopG family transcriptional regulator [Streptomyces sp. NPDC012693]|uniref:ribbon-helix-helix domain-containing protein n=1 Tax=unclassified Streptomyces TaxID=2593676 RepID=UPI0020304265|nr:CopG family transcriptional regulator [Streptomyces sp. MSC1_001]
MSMKRTNVYADPEDLAIIKEAAKRRGVSEAEIIRQGIHLAAMANRRWDEPLFSRTFEGRGRTPGKAEVREAVVDAVRRGSDAEAADESRTPGTSAAA